MPTWLVAWNRDCALLTAHVCKKSKLAEFLGFGFCKAQIVVLIWCIITLVLRIKVEHADPNWPTAEQTYRASCNFLQTTFANNYFDGNEAVEQHTDSARLYMFYSSSANARQLNFSTNIWTIPIFLYKVFSKQCHTKQSANLVGRRSINTKSVDIDTLTALLLHM